MPASGFGVIKWLLACMGFAEQVTAAIHIVLWSQLGVLVRIYLDLFYVNGCSGGWGVCLLSTGTDQ